MKACSAPKGNYALDPVVVSSVSVTKVNSRPVGPMKAPVEQALRSARITHGAVVRTRSAQASRDAMAKTITVTVRPMKVTSAVEIKGV